MKSLSLFFFCVFATQLSARDTKQEVRFFGYSSARGGPSLFVKTSSSRFEEVALRGTAPTKPMRVINEGGKIHLFGEENPESRGKNARPLLATIASDQKWNDVLIAIGSQKEEEEEEEEVKVSGSALSLSKKDFPNKAIRILNRTPTNVKGILGSTTVNLQPQESLNFFFKKGEESPVNVVFQYQKEGSDKWARLISTRWPVPEDGRRLMFIFQDPKSGRVLTKTIPLREDK